MRLPDLVPERLTPEQRRVYDNILAGPRGVVIGPHRVWLLSPTMADRAQALGEFCRFGSSLPPNLSELAIITIGAYWKAGFEWFHHAPIAIKAGVDAAAVEAIRQGREPELRDEKERIVHRFSRELLGAHRVSKPTYDEAMKVLGDVAVVDLVAILGYYTLICMSIVAFEIPTDDGSDPFANQSS
jgi:4-carboxymuconolactone decarboxylase